MKKTTTKITITRETVRTLLEGYVAGAFKAPHDLKEFTINRTGSIEMTIAAAEPAAALPLDETDPAEGFGEAAK